MSAADDQVRSAVARQASDWYVANQGGLPDQAERAAFVAWLKASPMHVEEYLAIALIARDLRTAADDSTVPLDRLLEQAAADESDAVVYFDRSRSVRNSSAGPPAAVARWMRAALAASVVLIAAMLAWPYRHLDFLGGPEVFSTAHGEQHASKLRDGSRLSLNTDSEVSVVYSRAERVVELRRGEALFEVRHDSTRTFLVEAGAVQVVAVGTRFNVYRRPGDTIVTVADGRVDVTARPLAGASVAPAIPPSTQRLSAGYQLRIDDSTGPAQPVRVDVDQALGWLQRKIEFENRPLGEVAAEFNRYARVPLMIDDVSLRALPVSGVFDAYDTDSFVVFLQSLENVLVEKTPVRIVVRRQRTTGQGVPPTPTD